MKIRGGYIYDLTPVPDSSFEPQVTDSNRHIFTVGSDIKVLTRFTLGIAYNYVLSESHAKNNTIPVNGVPAPLQANGNYSSDAHSLGLSCTFHLTLSLLKIEPEFVKKEIQASIFDPKLARKMD